MKTNTKIIVASAFTVGVLSGLCNVALKRIHAKNTTDIMEQ